MNIKLVQVKIKDLVEGYKDNKENGVVGYGGKLNIRPASQREFVYSEEQQKAVINSVFKSYPLNIMYWVENAEGNYELLDGQQRTMSICGFATNNYLANVEGMKKGFDNLTERQLSLFMDYEISVYICQNATIQEQLEWFKIINVAGELLTKQELRNAIYVGAWLTNAKLRFSKTNCVAYQLGEHYINGSPIRQTYLETALKWISNDNIEDYMAHHQKDENADELWQYYQNVIHWVEMLFPTYRKEMKGIDWGFLYNRYHDNNLLASSVDKQISTLMLDDEVTAKKGIYEYVLSKDERKLNLRAFSEKMKREVYERQQGICPICGNHYEINEMEADHITPWSQGGTTTIENCQMLCKNCNRRKSDK